MASLRCSLSSLAWLVMGAVVLLLSPAAAMPLPAPGRIPPCCGQPVQALEGLTSEQRDLLARLLAYKSTLRSQEIELFEGLLARDQRLNADQVAALQEFLSAIRAEAGPPPANHEPSSSSRPGPPPSEEAARSRPPNTTLPDFVFHPPVPPGPL